MKVASNKPRFRRWNPETLDERTSASTVAISPGASSRTGFHVAAVLVAEGRVGEQILDDLEALGLQHGGARGANAFHIHEWSREVQRTERVRSLARITVSCLNFWKEKRR